jgi:mediator of RNA polymerase II transcription subunit 5
MFRSTKPRTLLLISATLFSHAISARAGNKMDADVLNNGVSYFTGPLLNWTLVGVVKSLLREIQQKGSVTVWDY